MNVFSNEDYVLLAEDIIHDSFYANNSISGKIQAERRCAELIVRKVLCLSESKKITLGSKDISKKISNLPHHSFLEKALDGLRIYADPCSHTDRPIPPSNEDYEKSTECLLDLFSYLPIRYFDKYEFGKNGPVMRAFSLLPPIIRFKTLDYLFSLDNKNVFIIDRLVLVILKTKGSEKAIEWIDYHKNELMLLNISENLYTKFAQLVGAENSKRIIDELPKNMYELCKEKIELLRSEFDGKKSMYSTFEEAFPYYINNGHLEESSEENREFNDMMEFLYLGRKANNTDKLEDPFVIIKMIGV